MQVASFRVGAQAYALDIMQIKEIINPLPITPVPRAPAFVEGIVELRGAVLPIVDLRKRFGLPAHAPTRETKYVIAVLDGQIVGLVVDGVHEVLRVDEGEQMAPPEMALGADARFVTAVIKRGERMILMLDIGRVLSAAERSAMSRIEEAGS